MLLREDTAKIWDALKEHPSLTGFVLVGGTALTMHIGHRLSEDLDFCFGAVRLPRAQIKGLIRANEEKGVVFVANDSPFDIENSLNEGMDLNDYHQDYVVNGTVKVTLFSPEREVREQIGPGAERGPRVATLDEIFAMKCLVASERSKTRDWFDIYTLIRDHGYTASQFENVFVTSGVPQKMDIALAKLCSGKPDQEDEGYESLLATPPTVAQLSEFFMNVADEARTAAARRRKSKNRP